MDKSLSLVFKVIGDSSEVVNVWPGSEVADTSSQLLVGFLLLESELHTSYALCK